MKKFTPTLLGLMVGVAAFGQQPTGTKTAKLTVADPEALVRVNAPVVNSGSEAVLWSEDFANGIPATWVNQGYDGTLTPSATAVWEYRGTSTTPDNSNGSIGAYSGVSTGNNNPIASTTTANGFVIFDSDYLDNGGIAGNFGGGSAPAPHIGTLTTDAIDLTGSANVMLQMQCYARMYQSDMMVAFSTDGGSTWGDTVSIYNTGNLGVNTATPNVDVVSVNVSSFIGGQSNAKMRFIYDGTVGSVPGYYFWMFDDVKLVDLPRHELTFVVNPADGAPAHDMMFGSTPGNKYGLQTLKQVRSMSFDSNILNFGSEDQTGVNLEVKIYDGTQTLVTTLNSSSVALTSGSVADYSVMNTTSWTPTAEDMYYVTYAALSDSITAATAHIDTFVVYVTDSLMSLDFNRSANSIGTNNLGYDGSAIAVRIDLEDADRLFGAEISFASNSSDGGIIETTVYDTASFFAQGQPLAYEQHTITATDISNGSYRADLTGTDGYPVYLPAGAYYIVTTFYSNAGSNPINLRNDQTFAQPSSAALMYDADDQTWYSGYSNSLSLNAPFIRAIMCPASFAATCMTISIEEVSIASQVTVGPNPAEDKVFVNFGNDFSGDFNYEVVDLQGRVIMSANETATANSSLEVSLATLTPGVYLMNIAQGEAMSTYKLIVK